jgi:hypothetical protein
LVDLLEPKPRKERPPVGDYSLEPERIVSLSKDKYSKDVANIRFRQIAKQQGLVTIGQRETARYYVWLCLYRKG